MRLTTLFLSILIFFSLVSTISASRFYFDPATSQFNRTCEYRADIYIDMQGDRSNAADIEIYYDPSKIEILDSIPSIPGIQIGNGEAYEAYFANQVDNTNGVIRLAGGSFIGELQGVARFAYIDFASLSGVSSADFTINFSGTGDTLDSNIADTSTSLDTLTSVGNASYTFVTGPCIEDNDSPVIIHTDPINGQNNVPVDNDVKITLRDEISGIDIDTLVVNINGVEFTNNSPGVTITGDQFQYFVLIDGSVHPGFPVDEISRITTNVNDFSGNSRTSTITFNRSVAPRIEFTDPQNRELNVEESRDIQVVISDDGSGVDINSVQILLNGQLYTVNSEGFEYTGDPSSYTITLLGNSHIGFDTENTNTIKVNASDLKGARATRSITVNEPPIPDTIKPIVQFIQPIDVFDDFNPEDSIIFNVYDYQSGVNIDLLEIYVNGELFTISTEGVNYTGDSQSYTITINNYQDIIVDRVNSLRVVAYDFAGNVREAIVGLGICLDSGEALVGGDPLNNDEVCIGGTIPIGDSGVISTFIEELGPNGFTSTIGFLALLASLLPWLNLLNAPTLIFTLLSFIFGRKSVNRKAWGMIYDRNTLKPVQLATIRLYTAGTTNLAGQWISDMRGRYGLIVPKGTYRLEVVHPDYKSFETQVVIEKDGSNISLNIPLSTTKNYLSADNSFITDLISNIKSFFRKLTPIIFVFGFILSIIAVIFTPVLYNFLVLAFYIIFSILYYLYNRRLKRYAVVVDSQTGYRIPAAAIKVYDPKTMEVVDTQVTNSLGQFDYYGDPGEYYLLVAAWGYNFPSQNQRDLDTVDKGVAKFVKVWLKSGRNKLTIYVDPRKSDDLLSKANQKFGAM